MKCIVKNQYCENGWVVVNGKVKGKCKCVMIKAIYQSYDVYGNGKKELKRTFASLKDQEVGEYNFFTDKRRVSKGTTRELGQKMVSVLPKLIEDNATIILDGTTGTGKSQFASSLLLEATTQKTLGYYLPTRDLFEAIFDYRNREKLEKIYKKVRDIDTKIFILDDLGAELGKKDNRLNELLVVYNNLVREFKEKGSGLLVITSNFNPEKLMQVYSIEGGGNKRLFEMIYQKGRTKFYHLAGKHNFRQEQTEIDYL